MSAGVYTSLDAAKAAIVESALGAAGYVHPDVPAPVSAAIVRDEQARALAAKSAQFAVAWSAHLGGHWVVPLTEDGTEPVPGVQPSRDLGEHVAYWSEHPATPAGAPMGELYGTVAATFDDDGWQRLVDAATPVWEQARDDEDWGPPPDKLDPIGTEWRLFERTPASPATRQVSFFGSKAMRTAADMFKSAASRVRRVGLAWQWPQGGWRFRIPSRVAAGTQLVRAVPLPGAVVVVDGHAWTVQGGFPAQWYQMPTWVAEHLGGKR